jgi:hypothetical protein
MVLPRSMITHHPQLHLEADTFLDRVYLKNGFLCLTKMQGVRDSHLRLIVASSHSP